LADTLSRDTPPAPEVSDLEQNRNLQALIKDMEALPSLKHFDGFSNRDHDKILFGDMK
jgi:hypothetical protein